MPVAVEEAAVAEAEEEAAGGGEASSLAAFVFFFSRVCVCVMRVQRSTEKRLVGDDHQSSGFKQSSTRVLSLAHRGQPGVRG